MTRWLSPTEVVAAVITLAVNAPAAPLLLAMVEVRGWPTWWLIVCGMATAWASDAVWTLAQHAWATHRNRRRHTTPIVLAADYHAGYQGDRYQDEGPGQARDA